MTICTWDLDDEAAKIRRDGKDAFRFETLSLFKFKGSSVSINLEL